MKLYSSSQHDMLIELDPFELIALQVRCAQAMTYVEDHMRNNPGLSPARRNYWEAELSNAERDWSNLQRVLDEYNERL